MTVRELINELLRFDADEEIQFFDEKDKMLKIIDIGTDPSLPYIIFKEEREVAQTMEQVKFKDDDGVIRGGILNEKNGTIICGCCGGVFDIEELEIIETYDYWVDLTEFIIGE